MAEWRVIHADVLDGLAQLPDASVQTVVTSPPYWGLRDYGASGQLGLEPTPEAYVERMVGVFREVRRVLRPDGTCWLNLGDSYAGGGQTGRNDHGSDSPSVRLQGNSAGAVSPGEHRPRPPVRGLKPKDLVGIPWRVAFALQADGWYLRSDVIWSKPNPMPESVTDRPTKAHEYVFLLTRSARYFYDADAVRVPHARMWAENNGGSWAHTERQPDGTKAGHHSGAYPKPNEAGANLRSVWSIPTEPYPEAHFATFPKALVVPCVKAGTSEKGCCPECGAAWVRQVGPTEVVQTRSQRPSDGRREGFNDQPRAGGNSGLIAAGFGAQFVRETQGWTPSCSHYEGDAASGTSETGLKWEWRAEPCIVLDPFCGSGTTGVVALRHGRSFVGIELSAAYAEMARERIRNDGPLFNVAAEVTA